MSLLVDYLLVILLNLLANPKAHGDAAKDLANKDRDEDQGVVPDAE